MMSNQPNADRPARPPHEWTTEARTRRSDAGLPILPSPTTTWDAWQITTHWFAVDGQVIPAGVDVRSFSTDYGEPHAVGAEFFDGDVPQTVTRGLFDRLPLGQIIREHKRYAWAQTARMADQLADSLPDTSQIFDELADEITSPQRRASPRDALYRRVAALYGQAVARGESAPADAVRIGLELEARTLELEDVLSPERDVQSKRVRVRKWIAQARRRGYLPPAEKRGSQ